MRKALQSGLQAMQIQASEHQIQMMLDYLDLLIKWNKIHNLTAIKDPEEMVTLHILDSLSVLPYIKGPKVLDVGSGAGLPGIVLAIMLPNIDFVSVDTRGKKIQFQVLAAASIGLSNFKAEKNRIEMFKVEHPFDQIISRAFSSLSSFLTWTKHLIANEGEWLAMKGQKPKDEIAELGQEPDQTISLNVPNFSGERHLLVFKGQEDD
jgi:16S rRNA (guanine527-N7)-methyltransferase